MENKGRGFGFVLQETMDIKMEEILDVFIALHGPRQAGDRKKHQFNAIFQTFFKMFLGVAVY